MQGVIAAPVKVPPAQITDTVVAAGAIVKLPDPVDAVWFASPAKLAVALAGPAFTLLA